MMFHRACFILSAVTLLALPACSGKQTARTHVESSEHRLALGLADDFSQLDPLYQRISVTEHPAPTAYGLDGRSRENALLDAQRLLELLNEGRTEEALAMIEQLGLAPQMAGNPEALLAMVARLRGGARGGRSGLGGLESLYGSGAGLALDGVDGGLGLPDEAPRSTGSAIDEAFSSHRSAFDAIGP
jgi:hypothetical protein